MISIITSLYKSDAHLDNFLQHAHAVSLELQASNISHEFIIISNASSDYEQQRLAQTKLLSNFPCNIIYCARESLYTTWNRGIAAARYSIVTFWNVDDIRFAPAIKEGIEKITRGADVIYFPFIYKRYVRILNFPILVKRRIIKPIVYDRALFQKGMHCGPFLMISKQAFNKNGYFDTDFTISGDFDWCSRAATNNLVFVRGDVIAGIFTNDGRTLSGSRSAVQVQENNKILSRLHTS